MCSKLKLNILVYKHFMCYVWSMKNVIYFTFFHIFQINPHSSKKLTFLLYRKFNLMIIHFQFVDSCPNKFLCEKKGKISSFTRKCVSKTFNQTNKKNLFNKSIIKFSFFGKSFHRRGEEKS